MHIVTAVKQKKKTPIHKIIRHHAKHIFVPHKGNQYRPHLIRWTGLLSVFILVIVVQLGYNFATTGKFEILGRESNVTVSGLLNGTNNERVKSGLGNLEISDTLNQAAFDKASDMFANNYWAHESPSGVTPWSWLAKEGYVYDVAGENLAKNFPDDNTTVAAWMASPSHRANILNDKYTQVGFAVVDGTLEGKNTTLVVAFYGLPATKTLAVAGGNTNNPASYQLGAVNSGVGSPISYFGSALQSMNPATLGTLAMLTVVAVVAAAAHHYRYLLPKQMKKSWRVHHGAYKLVGSSLVILAIIVSVGGGQI